MFFINFLRKIMSNKDINDNDQNEQDNNKSEKNPHKTKQEYSKKIGNYVLLCEIGTGTFSKVAKAFHIITDQEVAVKILEKEKIKDEIDIERILREIEILKKVVHPNICQLYETYSTVHNFYLMMEHISGGDLFDCITDNNYLTENQSCKFFRQLISVIEYLNELGISHRDIKPENILLDNDHENIKLIDFGLSNYFSDNKLLKSSCGSPCYASPEMLSGHPYLGLTTDLWSAGIVLYSMLVGSLPFDDQELYELYKQIKLGKFYLPSTLSLEAIDLLKRILNVDPVKRIGLKEIKNHQWFKMDGYPLYKGIDTTNERIGYNMEVINYVMKNYFDHENDLDAISKNEFIEMIKDYYCNKYTATYYLTKKYILKIDDRDKIFKKEEIEIKSEEKSDSDITTNLKYDKKIYGNKENNSKNESKKNIKNKEKLKIDIEPNNKKNYNNYMIKNDINLEIKRSSNNNIKNDKEKILNNDDDFGNKQILLTEIDESNDKKINIINNDQLKGNRSKIDIIKSQTKKRIDNSETKRNNKKNELHLNNIKTSNLKISYRNSIEIKQKKFAKNLLLKGGSKTKENIPINNHTKTNVNSNNNSYVIKTWGNNSINHISKTNKIVFVHSGKNKYSNLNYNNYLCYNLNSNNNQKKKNENSTSINSYKGNKKQKQSPKKHKDKEKEKDKDKNRNKDKDKDKKKNMINNNSYCNCRNNFISNNKFSLTSSKCKENNFNFYLINNYINQSEIKNNKNSNNIISNSINFGKINSIKNDESESNINFSQYFIKSRKFNVLKTIDLPGTYTSRYNTEANNKKTNLNGSIKPYNKIKVNLKTESNKLTETNSPKYNQNKKSNFMTKRNSIGKDLNNNGTKSAKKKVSNIKINNNNNNIENKLIKSPNFKKDNSIYNNNKNINNFSNNINKNTSNSKIQYQYYNLNGSKPSSNNKILSNPYSNLLIQNNKNICLKSKVAWPTNYTKKIPKRNSSNSSKNNKNNMIIKENIFSYNNPNIIYRNDIYNKKKLINNSTQRNNYKDFKYKELFPIEEDDKIFDIKCRFNTKKLKNKILLLNENNANNKCNSPKEFYSFNESGLNSAYHSDVSIIKNNKKSKKDNKMKQNFSNIYNRKKNLLIKTEQNSSTEKTNSPQFTEKKIKYIYKSKLSLY